MAYDNKKEYSKRDNHENKEYEDDREVYKSPDELLEEESKKKALDSEYEEEAGEMDDTDEEIIKMFNDNKAIADGRWSDIHEEMEDDWEMYTLNQWTESGKRARGLRPRVTVDISRKFVKAAVAETYRNPPGIQLTARTEGAGKKAKFISDAVRYIENRTGAKYAYTWAKECAAVCGIGWLKVTYRYDENNPMPAVIDIDRIDDPLSITIDPDFIQIDGSDARFIFEEHAEEDGEKKYTYWWIDDDDKVKWAIIKGDDVVEKGVFPSTAIPLIPVFGEVYNIRNKLSCFGLMRQVKDTQRSYNYVMSETIERLALTPKSPIIHAIGSIPKAYEKNYARSMTEPVPLLGYTPFDKDGRPLPPPTRTNTNPDVAWSHPTALMLQTAANEVTGIYPDSYGAQSKVIAGVAIDKMADNSDRGQLVYDEHLQISIKHTGVVILSMLDEVVTPGGLLPMMSEEGETSTKAIGEFKPVLDELDRPMPMLDEMGRPVFDQNGMMQPQMEAEIPDLDVTDLEINVNSAPAYATRKAEGVAKAVEVLPMFSPMDQAKLAPALLRKMDFPGAEELANILSPQDDEISPEQLQSQMQEMQAQMDQVNQMNQELRNDNMQLNLTINKNSQAMMEKTLMDNQTKITLEEMKQAGSITETQMKIDADAEKATAGNTIEIAKIAQSRQENNREIVIKTAIAQANILEKVDVNVGEQRSFQPKNTNGT